MSRQSEERQERAQRRYDAFLRKVILVPVAVAAAAAMYSRIACTPESTDGIEAIVTGEIQNTGQNSSQNAQYRMEPAAEPQYKEAEAGSQNNQ